MIHSQLSSPKDGKAAAEQIMAQNARFAQEVMVEVYNTLNMQRRILERHMDPSRDIDSECGYQDSSQITDEHCKELYRRNPIAKRVVDVWPCESWKATPRVYEDEDTDTTTAFEEAWNEVCRGLSGSEFFEDEEANPMFEYMERVDKHSGIGRYGCILLGVDDGKDFSEELTMLKDGKGSVPKRKLLYLRVLDSTVCEVSRLDGDRHSPRYGLPTEYNVTLERLDMANISGLSIPTAGDASTFTQKVHWTRIVHIADNTSTNDVFGERRMEVVWDRIYDSKKLYGGGAEMFWKGAFPGISFETHPQLGGEVRINTEDLKNQLENYMHGLQRYLALAGMTANSLTPQVADPSAHIDKMLEAICISLEIPKRIFMGSERGELASTTDADSWNDRVKHRQVRHCTLKIVVPIVSRLIAIGVLPVPQSGKFKVDWPDLSALTDQEKSDIAAKETEALTKYVAGDLESLIEEEDFLVHVMRWDRKVAMEVVANRIKSLEKIAELDEEFGPEEPELPPEFGGEGEPMPPGQEQPPNGAVPPPKTANKPAALEGHN